MTTSTEPPLGVIREQEAWPKIMNGAASMKLVVGL